MIQEATLVPARRLGALLRERRDELGLSLSQISRNLPHGVDELARIEQGLAPLSDVEVSRLLSAYGTAASPVVPERFGLTIDLTDSSMRAGGHRVALGDAGASGSIDDILGRYLSLLYLLRDLEPGTALPLRRDDLDVLARALQEAVTDVEKRLVALMISDRVEPWFSRLRHRLAVPAAGILVGLTTVGGLVLVQFPDGERPTLEPVVVAPTIAVAEVVPAVIVERTRIGDLSYSPGDPGSVGLAAEELIAYPIREVLVGWTIEYTTPRAGFRGNTNTVTRTISVYVAAGDTPAAVAEVLGHEVGHAIDVMYLSEKDRRQWMQARGLLGPWWPESGRADFGVGAGDFAEAISAVLTGSPSDSRLGEFTDAQLELVRALMP